MVDDRDTGSREEPLASDAEGIPATKPELRFDLLVSTVTDYAIFLLDPNGIVKTWNPGAKLIKGYEANEIIGRSIENFYPPEARASGRPHELLERALTEGRVEDEGWRVRKDGSRFWADVVITALRDPKTGQLEGFAKITRDLSERRSSEEKLRQTEERFRLLVEQVRDYAIFMLDPSGLVTTWNAGAERIKGYHASEVLGRPFAIFYDEAEQRAGKPQRDLEIARSIGRFEDETWRVRKDGTRVWASVVITALHGSKGELIGFAKVTRDLTERRAAEEERLRLARAQEAIRLRDEFLAIASHELKTPLTALQLQLQSLHERVDAMDVSLANKIERATRSSSRLTQLVESLLDVSRIATGRFSLHLEPLDLGDVVAQQVDSLRLQGQRGGSEILLSTPGSLPGRWDRVRIEQVLANLLSNALKYGSGKPVQVSVSRCDDQAVLSVRDHGPGIAEQDLGRIFGRFERAVSMRHYGGLGLGLYVTQQIVSAHGGTVSVRNEPDGGACFTVRLPIALEEPRDVSTGELH